MKSIRNSVILGIQLDVVHKRAQPGAKGNLGPITSKDRNESRATRNVIATKRAGCCSYQSFESSDSIPVAKTVASVIEPMKDAISTQVMDTPH